MTTRCSHGSNDDPLVGRLGIGTYLTVNPPVVAIAASNATENPFEGLPVVWFTAM